MTARTRSSCAASVRPLRMRLPRPRPSRCGRPRLSVRRCRSLLPASGPSAPGDRSDDGSNPLIIRAIRPTSQDTVQTPLPPQRPADADLFAQPRRLRLPSRRPRRRSPRRTGGWTTSGSSFLTARSVPSRSCRTVPRTMPPNGGGLLGHSVSSETDKHPHGST